MQITAQAIYKIGVKIMMSKAMINKNNIKSAVNLMKEIEMLASSASEDIADSETVNEAWNKIENFYKDMKSMKLSLKQILNGWTKTDDLQYVKKIDDGIYKIVEARYAEDKYIVCKGKIVIKNWLDSDGNYDSDCVEVIKAYYESVDDFHKRWADLDMREHVLAEMIFEEMPYFTTDKYELCSEEAVEEKLQEYINTDSI